MVTLSDSWIFARLLADGIVNGELHAVSGRLKPLADHLNGLRSEDRHIAFEAARIAMGNEGMELQRLVMEADPAMEAPPPISIITVATLADYARINSGQRWVWDGWIAKGVLNVLAAEPGTGKTRFALDLARRLWLGLRWPDGTQTGFPPGTKTLWIQADRAFHEMLEASRAFDMPDDAIHLASSPDDPTGSLSLDDPEDLAALASRIEAVEPALVVIDTVGMTTAQNLCKPEDARAYFGPLMDLAAASGVALLGQTHLSKDKEALGRRIVEKARIVIKMTKPDPEGQPNRRRLWVDKTAALNPPALGITMRDSGNDYDTNPPTEPDPSKGGRPNDKREKAKDFIHEALTEQNDRIGKELEAEWTAKNENAKTFWRAVDDMETNGELVKDGGPGTRRQAVLHLASHDPDDQP
jgi:KaiC/GvpD/RAD55 family RecA-like ATPase